MKKNKELFKSADDACKIYSLKTLRWFIGRFGCPEQLQKKMNMTVRQIVMLANITDIRDSKKSIPLYKTDYEIFENNPDISYYDLQKIFDERAENVLTKKKKGQKNKSYNLWSYDDVLRKNDDLISQLNRAQADFCGIGIKHVRMFFAGKVKHGDSLAKLYSTALEAEIKNIAAKEWNNDNRDATYERKAKRVRSLIKLCKERDDVVYGYQDESGFATNTVIYFELPQMKQISFHMKMSSKEKADVPVYEGIWDRKVNSTLPKIEEALMRVYRKEIIYEKEMMLRRKEQTMLKILNEKKDENI